MQELALSFGFGVITASVLSLAAVAITPQFGITNYINFAFGSYATLAAYLAWELNVQLHWSFWLAVLGSACGMGIFSVVVGRFLLQPYARRNLPYVYLLIVTLALWLIISNGIVALWGPNSKQFDVPSETPLVIGPSSLRAHSC